MEGVKRISTGYVPRPLQQKLHTSLSRFNVIVCHRRFGKTVFAINEMIDKGLRNEKVDPRYAYLAPTYGQAKRVAWDYLKRYTAPIPGATPNEADLRVDIPRPHLNDTLRFTLLGADNPVSLKGVYLDGVIPDEYAEMNPMVWREVIRPTLSDRKGWAIFLGTPKGRNNFHALYDGALHGFPNPEGVRFKDPEWSSFMFKASETGIIDKEELDSARRTMTPEEYEQEYECDFASGLVGAYFAKELAAAEKEGRIGDYPYDAMIPVDLYFDLGINDTCAVWFGQSLRGRHRMVDYYEVCGASIPDVVAEIRKRKYVYGRWFLPHDAGARDFSTGVAQEQVFHSLGARPLTIIPKANSKRDPINAARMLFGSVQFDRQKCGKGLEMLAQYQRKWNTKNNVFEDAPLHNPASNCADAFLTFAMGARPDSRDVTGSNRYDGSTDTMAESFNPFERSAG